MSQALILGCSHAAGAEMEYGPDVVNEPGKDFFLYGRSRSYPVKLASKLGYSANNQSISGGSNDAMFRIFENSDLNSGDIIIACWSGINRSELYDNKQWIAIAPGKSIEPKYENYFKEWLLYGVSDPASKLNKIKNIVALNALAQQQNVKVVNIDSFWPVNDSRYGYWPVEENFWDWCIGQNYPRTAWGHFFEDAHEAFANYILSKLDKNMLTQ